MIYVNSICDLKPYMKYIPAKQNDYFSSECVFEFKINNELQDVVFNNECNLMKILSSEYDGVLNLFCMVNSDKDAEICNVTVIAKNVVVKDKLICHKLYCKNLQIDNEIECKYITANGNISGKNIKGFYVFCSSINCSTIECEDIDCTKFNADELKVMGMSFKKISYYGLKENPEIDMSNWNNECFLDKRMVR